MIPGTTSVSIDDEVAEFWAQQAGGTRGVARFHERRTS